LQCKFIRAVFISGEIMSNDVAVGQIWADNTPLHLGRTLRVDAFLADGWILTHIVTPGHNALNEAGDLISLPLSRMRPTETGFRLIQGADGTPIEELV
jgi:hypothetical protein